MSDILSLNKPFAFVLLLDIFDRLQMGENYLSAERNTWHMFKVIRSNTEIAITATRIVRFRSNLVQSLITSLAIYYKCSRSTGQRSKPQGERSRTSRSHVT